MCLRQPIRKQRQNKILMKHKKCVEAVYFDPEKLCAKIASLSVEEISVIEKINDYVAAAESIDELLGFLFQSTRLICPCDRIGLAFIENDSRVVAYHAVADYEPVFLNRGYAEDLQGSSLEFVIKKGFLRVINDLSEYYRNHFESISTGLILKEGVQSSMTCPMSVDKRNVGLLFRSSRNKNAYDEHQVVLHMAIAERLSQAVEKAYRIEQLQAANKSYTEMLGFVSHELKNPIASIITDARLISDGMLGEVNQNQSNKLGKLIDKGNYLLGLIKDYLDLARIEAVDLKPAISNINDFEARVINPAIEILNPQIEIKKMLLNVESGSENIQIQGDAELLTIVTVNLLGNAIKYGYENSVVKIKIKKESEYIVVSVRNEGPGFPESQKGRLFRKFSRIMTPELKKEKGTGIGLYTCWRIVKAHNGKIFADSVEGKWAEFAFKIPVKEGKDIQ